MADSLKKCSNTGLLGILMWDFLNSSCKMALLIKYNNDPFLLVLSQTTGVWYVLEVSIEYVSWAE